MHNENRLNKYAMRYILKIYNIVVTRLDGICIEITNVINENKGNGYYKCLLNLINL